MKLDLGPVELTTLLERGISNYRLLFELVEVGKVVCSDSCLGYHFGFGLRKIPRKELKVLIQFLE
jgi:hypothetical protein